MHPALFTTTGSTEAASLSAPTTSKQKAPGTRFEEVLSRLASESDASAETRPDAAVPSEAVTPAAPAAEPADLSAPAEPADPAKERPAGEPVEALAELLLGTGAAGAETPPVPHPGASTELPAEGATETTDGTIVHRGAAAPAGAARSASVPASAERSMSAQGASPGPNAPSVSPASADPKAAPQTAAVSAVPVSAKPASAMSASAAAPPAAAPASAPATGATVLTAPSDETATASSDDLRGAQPTRPASGETAQAAPDALAGAEPAPAPAPNATPDLQAATSETTGEAPSARAGTVGAPAERASVNSAAAPEAAPQEATGVAAAAPARHAHAEELTVPKAGAHAVPRADDGTAAADGIPTEAALPEAAPDEGPATPPESEPAAAGGEASTDGEAGSHSEHPSDGRPDPHPDASARLRAAGRRDADRGEGRAAEARVPESADRGPATVGAGSMPETGTDRTEASAAAMEQRADEALLAETQADALPPEADSAELDALAGRSAADTRTAAGEARADAPGRARSASWPRAALLDAARSFSVQQGWKTLEVQLEEGHGSMVVRARKDGENMAISVGFTDPQLRMLAQNNADRLQQLLQEQYEAPVDFSLSTGNPGERDASDARDGRPGEGGRTTGLGGPASDEPPVGAARRAARPGSANEWVG